MSAPVPATATATATAEVTASGSTFLEIFAIFFGIVYKPVKEYVQSLIAKTNGNNKPTPQLGFTHAIVISVVIICAVYLAGEAMTAITKILDFGGIGNFLIGLTSMLIVIIIIGFIVNLLSDN